MCQRPSAVSTVSHILHPVQVSVSCLQNAKSVMYVKIYHMPWSRHKTECVAKSRPVVMLSFKSCPIYGAKAVNVIMSCNETSGSPVARSGLSVYVLLIVQVGLFHQQLKVFCKKTASTKPAESCLC
jgi:hypothetical protein